MKLIESGNRQGRRAFAGFSFATQCAIGLLGVWTSGCEFEGDEACGPHQVYVTGKGLLDYAVCVCDEEQGYVFDTVKGYGCKPCPEEQVATGGKCVSEGEPGAGDAGSEEDGSHSSEPTGVGEYCESNDDCAEFDAQYCALPTHTCMVDNCATGENECGSASSCCDYSALLAGFSMCVPADQLDDGDCPMGGMKVEQ